MSEKSKWLIAYANGGAWSGYECAVVIEANSNEEANCAAHEIAAKEFFRGGLSWDVEKIISTVHETALYQSRLKQSAKEQLALGVPYGVNERAVDANETTQEIREEAVSWPFKATGA